MITLLNILHLSAILLSGWLIMHAMSYLFFFTKILSLMEWDAACRYRLYGESIRSGGEFLFAFDLCRPEITASPKKGGTPARK